MKLKCKYFTSSYIIATLAIFLSAPLYATDYWFKSVSSVYSDKSSWYLDQDRTQAASSAPTTFDDSAYFYKMSYNENWNNTAWVTQVDVYIGNVISAGGGGMQFGKETIRDFDTPINFQVNGKISAQICDTDSQLKINTGFDTTQGTTSAEISVGSIEVGTELFPSSTAYEKYGSATLYIDFSDSRIEESNMVVNGNINIGGGLPKGSFAELYMGVDKITVKGIIDMKRNSSAWSNFYLKEASVIECGGLNTDNVGDFTFTHTWEARGANSTLILNNAAGTNYQFIGAIVSEGTFNSDPDSTNSVINVVMQGEGTQRISQGVLSRTDISGKEAGKYSVLNGKLFLDNARLRSDMRLATLLVDGGAFGASCYDSGQTAVAYFQSAEIKNGGLLYENLTNHNIFEVGVTDKIVVEGELSKTGAGKIFVDFTDRSGAAFDLSYYSDYIAEDVESIEFWTEILTAETLNGFNLDSADGDGIYDADSDFYAQGLENGTAVFRWVESSGNGYSLQVGFAQVPEPAFVALTIGIASIFFAARRGRRA